MKPVANSDTNFFNIVGGVFQEDTLAPYIFIICLDYILWMSIGLIQENCFTLKKLEAEDIPQKQWQMETMQMIWHFSQTHPPKLNPCCIAWNKQQEALASTWMQIKQISWVINKKETSPV